MPVTFSLMTIGTDTYRRNWTITRGADPTTGEAALAVAHGLPGIPFVSIIPITNGSGAVNQFSLAAQPSASYISVLAVSVICGVTMCAALTAILQAEYHSIVHG